MLQPRLIIYPSSYFNEKKIEEDYKNEYDAANGLFQAALYGYEKWHSAGKLSLHYLSDLRKTPGTVYAIYRGWMMSPDEYSAFYSALQSEGIQLITDPESYKTVHCFPYAYPYIKEDTTGMETFPLHCEIDVEMLKRKFGRFMVKDYTKSVKGGKFPDSFGDETTQESFDSAMRLFYEYRGDLLTGGICIKEFLRLKKYNIGGKQAKNEWRVFYINGINYVPLKNSGQPEYAATPPEELVRKYSNIPSPFYTIDFAEIEDGRWAILETGDGGVSSVPDGHDLRKYYSFLHSAFAGSK